MMGVKRVGPDSLTWDSVFLQRAPGRGCIGRCSASGRHNAQNKAGPIEVHACEARQLLVPTKGAIPPSEQPCPFPLLYGHPGTPRACAPHR